MELFHVLNRGVEKRDIVLDDMDRARFVHDLFEFNDATPAGSTYWSFKKDPPPYLDLRSPDMLPRRREQIVSIHGWCLMGNHYHLLLSEQKEGGITKFIRKLNIGYAKYFNERYKRSGALFQGRTKKKHIDNHAYFLYILHYIHLNPLDFLKEASCWREKNLRNTARAMAHLRKYRWSSFLDYIDIKNFPSVIDTSLFRDIFRGYEKELSNYLKEMEAEILKNIALE